jgi:hypothetical protein
VDKAGRREVKVSDDPKSKCGGTSTAERDVFLVDPAGDRLTVDDPTKRAPLRKWLDGTDPDAPGKPPQALDNLLGWKAPLKQAMVAAGLAPIRLQFYGRGSYPVVTLAGWADVGIKANAPPESVAPKAEKLCAANGNRPFAMFGGLERKLLLRVRCPGVRGPKAQVAWEKLE